MANDNTNGLVSVVLELGDYEEADSEQVSEMRMFASGLGAGHFREQASEDDGVAYLAFTLPAQEMDTLKAHVTDDGTWEIVRARAI